jgi:hypothetical protein
MDEKQEITLAELHEAQKEAVKNAPNIPPYKNGRSIVTSVYRQEIPGAVVLMSELVRLGFNLPIEIFYRDEELNEPEISELRLLSQSTIVAKKIQNNVLDFKDRWGNVKGWATKFYSIMESEYAENMWIDCDNFPIRNCVDLFDDPEYVKKGSLFWRDVYSVDRANQYYSESMMWKIFNVPANDGEPFESGQFLVNKPKVWDQLMLMKHFTDQNQIYYQFGGDAECWRMAWQNSSNQNNRYHQQFNYHASDDVPYGFMPYGPFHKGVQNPWHKYGGGTVMVQRDRNGAELFNHRNISKFSWHEDNPFNEDVQNESNYHMIVNHLKAKYGVK